MNNELKGIFALFADEEPASCEVISTGRDENDFRETVIVTAVSGNKLVLKLADNAFTFPGRIKMWQRAVNEYRALGCYCPQICTDKSGEFPAVTYKGHRCTVYAEEYSLFSPAEVRGADQTDCAEDKAFMREAWLLTARIAAKHFDFTEYPSVYCLYDIFCSDDETDEVLENALEWKRLADECALPERLKEQADRIWQLWLKNREALEPKYRRLPASVFQGDLNPTNVLIDGDRNFKGLIDFNLCGREAFLNYIFREINDSDPAAELNKLRDTLSLISEVYEFSELEKSSALMLYRYVKPLYSPGRLKNAAGDEAKTAKLLDETEHYLTADTDFASFMSKNNGKSRIVNTL